MNTLPSIKEYLDISIDVQKALENHTPVVSLESHAILQGIPYPQNVEIYLEMQHICAGKGVVPALIGINRGKIKVGYTISEIRSALEEENLLKISSSGIASAISSLASGGTTISATAHLTHRVGIDVFIAGGFGGVHPGPGFDVSADLYELARTPILLICSGMKAILDMPATIEVLEALTIPVLGYQTDNYPGFFLRDTGLPVQHRVDGVSQIAEQFYVHRVLGRKTAMIVAHPAPSGQAFEHDEYSEIMEEGYQLAEKKGVAGGEITPFLLRFINDHYQGKLFEIIHSVLVHNMHLACDIAVRLEQ